MAGGVCRGQGVVSARDESGTEHLLGHQPVLITAPDINDIVGELADSVIRSMLERLAGSISDLKELFINTGFTGPSGVPSSDASNDTFWQSAWTHILAGQSADLMLDFDNAIPWGIDDNQPPHTTVGSDGVGGSINAYDRTELSAIGFEVKSDSNPEAIVLVTPIPEPASFGLLAVGVLLIVSRH